MLTHWLTLVFEEWRSKKGSFTGEWSDQGKFQLRLSPSLFGIAPVLQGRVKNDRKGNKVLRLRILPGTNYVFKVAFLLVVLEFGVAQTIGFSLRVLLPVTGIFLIAAHYLFWLAAGKLRSFRKIIEHIAVNDEFPED